MNKCKSVKILSPITCSVLGLVARVHGDANEDAIVVNVGSSDPPVWVVARTPLHFIPALSTSPSGYTPAQVRHAYGFDQIIGDGTGQTIAVVVAYGSDTAQTDLNFFSDTFGIPRARVRTLYIKGRPKTVDGIWTLETALDVEWAHAVAPGAKILLVTTKTSSFNDLLNGVDAAVKAGATQVSMSWIGGEGLYELGLDYHFNVPGVSFLAASGDGGSGVGWPAASPYVIAVGGTSLYLDVDGNRIEERGWSGSGGGISAFETAPAFQAGWQFAAGRGVPDVSYNGDPFTGFPVYIGNTNFSGSSGWVQVGGTSAGAPQWAGLIALANSARLSPLSTTGNAVYGAANHQYAPAYLDIILGSNGDFFAGTRYDYVTGLGSPRAEWLVPALSGF